MIESSSHKLFTRTPISITKREKKYAASYSEATHLNVLGPISEIQITKIDADRNMIFGKNSKGEHQIDLIKYAHALRAFQENLKDFAVGDHIVFTKYDAYLGLINGLAAIIKEISRDGKMVVESNSKKLEIDARTYHYFDHGYAIAHYDSLGSTYRNLIFSGTAETTNYNSFYAAASRYNENFHLITNNIELFKERASIEIQMPSVLEHDIKNIKFEADQNQEIQKQKNITNLYKGVYSKQQSDFSIDISR